MNGNKASAGYKMAACGIDCAEFGSYKATMNQDMESAAQLIDWYRGMGWIGENEGAEAVMKLSPLCKGCWDPMDECFFKGCANCILRNCCVEKQLDHCGECADFPCAQYKEFAAWPEHHQTAMERLSSLRVKS